jgi:LysM repeat protein
MVVIQDRNALLSRRRFRHGLSALAATAGIAAASPGGALASVSHLVAPGETLSGIAAVNGLSTETLAAWNGIDPETYVVSGTSIMVPTAAEAGVTSSSTTASSTAAHTVVAGESLSSVAAANGITIADLAAANGLSPDSFLVEGTTVQVPAATTTAAPSSSISLGSIYTPEGDVYLESSAASQWNAMRQESLADYGQDIYPNGPLSAYRTSDQQEQLYQSFLDGTGDPANPPGSSSHELGLSVDVATPEMRSVVDQIGYQFGWGKFEAPDEWWHVSYGG